MRAPPAAGGSRPPPRGGAFHRLAGPRGSGRPHGAVALRRRRARKTTNAIPQGGRAARAPSGASLRGRRRHRWRGPRYGSGAAWRSRPPGAAAARGSRAPAPPRPCRPRSPDRSRGSRGRAGCSAPPGPAPRRSSRCALRRRGAAIVSSAFCCGGRRVRPSAARSSAPPRPGGFPGRRASRSAWPPPRAGALPVEPRSRPSWPTGPRSPGARPAAAARRRSAARGQPGRLGVEERRPEDALLDHPRHQVDRGRLDRMAARRRGKRAFWRRRPAHSARRRRPPSPGALGGSGMSFTRSRGRWGARAA